MNIHRLSFAFSATRKLSLSVLLLSVLVSNDIYAKEPKEFLTHLIELGKTLSDHHNISTRAWRASLAPSFILSAGVGVTPSIKYIFSNHELSLPLCIASTALFTAIALPLSAYVGAYCTRFYITQKMKTVEALINTIDSSIQIEAALELWQKYENILCFTALLDPHPTSFAICSTAFNKIKALLQNKKELLCASSSCYELSLGR